MGESTVFKNVAHLIFVLHSAMATKSRKIATRPVKKAARVKPRSRFERNISSRLSVGVRELRQDASKVLVLVNSGHSVVITKRGIPVAEIKPIPRDSHQDLIQAGILIPAKANFDPQSFAPASNPNSLSLVATLLKDREEALR